MATSRPPTPEELEKWNQQIERDARKEMEKAIIGIDPVGNGAVPLPDPRQAVPVGGTPSNPVKRAWKDADDFYRETSGSDPVFLEDIADSDSYYIHNTVSGNVYRLTSTEVMKGGMSRFRMGEFFSLNQIDMNSKPAFIKTVHVMHQGSVLCKNVKGRPVDWPKGHEWVPLDVQTEKEVCNCMGCIEVWRKLLG